VKKAPLISICIVAYNLEKYIRDCIESALCQDFENYEIILVDNGSDDHTVQICTEYARKESKIRFFSLGKPTKAVRGHIEAVKQARGRYIHLIDGDDCVRVNYLQEIASVIYEKEPDLIMGTFECIVEEGATNYMDAPIEKERINQVPTKEAIEYILTLPRFNRFVWRFVVKRELFQLVDFGDDVKYLVGVDGLKGSVWLFCANSIYFVSRPFYFYRRRVGSTVMSVNHRFTIDFLKLVFASIEKFSEIAGGNTEKKHWIRCLAAKQLEWYVKLFFIGADCLREEELDETEQFLRSKESSMYLLYEYPTKYLYQFADKVTENLNKQPIRTILHSMETKLIECLSVRHNVCYVFPTGTAAFHVSRFLDRHGFELKGYLDNDDKKNQTMIYGVPCESFSQFSQRTNPEERNRYSYIIATIYETVEVQIEHQLLDAGVKQENIIKRMWL